VGDLWRAIVDSIQFLWPLRLVHTWELGGYYVFGRFWKIVRPGCYLVVPWFCDVKTISCVRAIVGTGRQDITLLDGSFLSFSATVWAQVVDARKALNDVDEPHSTTQELLASLLADALAETPVDRLRGSRRKVNNLFAQLEQSLKTEAATYGVEVSSLRFTSFVLGARVHRLLIDQTPIAQW
jgi:regulator of protease activity HflC (stomatin/prohibitin superfamily)